MKDKKELATALTCALKEYYPSALCSLDYKGDPWRLLVMGRLSAQCTDLRVNIVAKELFERWETPLALASAPLSEVEEVIRPCGLYKTKAKDIIAESKMLVYDFSGVLPNSMEKLLLFPGVGRKIANLLLGDIYSLPAIVVDTHCIRISRRMGLVDKDVTAPERIEKILSSLIEPSEQSDFCHRIVLLGREFCTARKPLCEACPLSCHCEKISI